jgi:hypothetical protein
LLPPDLGNLAVAPSIMRKKERGAVARPPQIVETPAIRS